MPALGSLLLSSVLVLGYTDDTDGNQFDQVILGLGATNSDW